MLKILVVDDSKAVHAYIENSLKNLEVEIVHVFDGQQALDMVAAQGDVFSLVLLDWEMPVLDGPSTFDELTQCIGAPIVMMTTKNDPNDIAMMLEKGVAEYMLKPFTPDILVEKIENVISKDLSYAG